MPAQATDDIRVRNHNDAVHVTSGRVWPYQKACDRGTACPVSDPLAKQELLVFPGR